MKTYFEKEEENDHIKFFDVNDYVYKKIEAGIKQCIFEKRLIDWDKLEAYCYEFFELPDNIIDNALIKIKEKYKDEKIKKN